MTARTFGRRGVSEGGISAAARGPARPRFGASPPDRQADDVARPARRLRRRGARPGRGPGRPRPCADDGDSPRAVAEAVWAQADIADRRLCALVGPRPARRASLLPRPPVHRRAAGGARRGQLRRCSRPNIIRPSPAWPRLCCGCRRTPISIGRMHARPPRRAMSGATFGRKGARRRRGDGRPPRRLPRRGAGAGRAAGRRAGGGAGARRGRPAGPRRARSRSAPPICCGSSSAAFGATVSISAARSRLSPAAARGRCSWHAHPQRIVWASSPVARRALGARRRVRHPRLVAGRTSACGSAPSARSAVGPVEAGFARVPGSDRGEP